MDVHCNQAALDFWEPAADFAAYPEESAEFIVPDSCPDMARILSADGTVCLHQCEAREGKVHLSGTVQTTVLYIPEKTQTIQSVRFNVPFQFSESCPAECTAARALVSAEEVTARALNPRKLRIQCRLAAGISAYRAVSLTYTTDIDAEPGLALELLPRQESVELISSLTEQSLTCEETFPLPQNRGAVAAILCTRPKLAVEDAKIIGTKAVVKGKCLTDVLVKYDSGICESSALELPFSHISETSAPQTARLSAAGMLTAFTVESGSNEDGGGELRLSFTAQLQLTAWESRELRFVADLYSTAYDLSCEMQELHLPDAAEPQQRRQAAQEALDIGFPAERVLLLTAGCGAVSVGQDASGASELRTTLRIQALCQTEDGRVLTAQRSAEIVLPCPELEGEDLRCRACCTEAPTAVATADGLLARVPVDFFLKPRGGRTIRCVASVRCDENAPKDPAELPSLVLRRRREGESLWAIAKAHDSTTRDILAANGCGAESELPEGLLLIPRRRA